MSLRPGVYDTEQYNRTSSAPTVAHTRAQRRWGNFLHCVHSAHAEVEVIRLVVTVLSPWNPFQKNEQSKNI